MLKEGIASTLDVEIEDWQLDKAVRACSYGARGLWWEMLLLMARNDRRGFLTSANGAPLSPEQITRQTGGSSVEEALGLLRELEDSGVFSRSTDGVIFNRRMAREERERPRRERELELAAQRQARYREKHPRAPALRHAPPSLSQEETTKSAVGGECGEGSGEGKRASRHAEVFPVGLSEHPAVRAFYLAFTKVPTIFAQEQIEAAVGDDDLEEWESTLDYWKVNDYRPGSVGKMIERFKGNKFEHQVEGRNNGGKRSYSQRQSRAITSALRSVGLTRPRADGDPDAGGDKRRLPDAGAGRRRTGGHQD